VRYAYDVQNVGLGYAQYGVERGSAGKEFSQIVSAAVRVVLELIGSPMRYAPAEQVWQNSRALSSR